MSQESQPTNGQVPFPQDAPVVSQQQPQQIACPRCLTVVQTGTAFCPQCGNALPPPGISYPSEPAKPPKPKVALIIGVVLLVVLIGGVAGYVVYSNVQQQILFAAKNSEQTAASQAVDQLQLTCFSYSNDTSHLSYSPYTGFSGYIVIYETFGFYNPTAYKMDTTWTFTANFRSAGLTLTDTVQFHIAAQGRAYPRLDFQISGTQLNNIPSSADFSDYAVTLDASYAVTGIYGTYMVPQHESYDSSSSASGISLGAGSGLPEC